MVDLNVVLDVLLEREPHAAAAAGLWAAIERKNAVGFLPAHGFTTIHYLAQRARGARFARQTIADLLSVFRVASLGEGTLRKALELSWSDFEDAVCATCAAASKCHAIVTREPGGFRGATLPVIDPAAAVVWLSRREDK